MPRGTHEGARWRASVPFADRQSDAGWTTHRARLFRGARVTRSLSATRAHYGGAVHGTRHRRVNCESVLPGGGRDDEREAIMSVRPITKSYRVATGERNKRLHRVRAEQ